MTSLDELFKIGVSQLKSAKIENPELDVTWIIEHYTGKSTVDRIAQPHLVLSEVQLQKIKAALERRKNFEPLAYILGEKEFLGLKFMVNSCVLIPRPETELLAEWAISKITQLQSTNPARECNILDLGTGSGCLGLSILKKTNNTKLSAVDISGDALDVAKRNAKCLNVSDRSSFSELDASQLNSRGGSLLSTANRYDLIVANPPYISPDDPAIDPWVKRHEPHLALYSSEGGLAHISSWLNAIPPFLNESCFVGFEVGATQARETLSLFDCLGIFSKSYVLKDYAGHERFVCGDRLKGK